MKGKMTSKKLNQSGFILPLLIVLAAIAAGVYVYFSLQPSKPIKPDVSQGVEEKANKKSSTVNLSEISAEVAITKDGFMPATISVAAGQQVTFVNKDRSSHRVIPYPLAAARNVLADLDSEDLQPTDTFTYSFEKSGTFTLSDDISSGKHRATVVVN